MEPTYPRAVLSAALQGLLSGAWIAAGELPAAQRRLLRAGSVLVLSAAAFAVGGDGDDGDQADQPRELGPARVAVSAGLVGASVGAVIGRRRFERYWLAKLARDGHPHPHRVLAVRMGLVSFAGTLPGRLVKVHEHRRA